MHILRQFGDFERMEFGDVRVVAGTWNGNAQELNQPREDDGWISATPPIFAEAEASAVDLIEHTRREYRGVPKL